ncbi:hypothetical protein DY000_02059317 [Brassica cretica]|uniref:Uncharacterized protein n=1 Tax=Brassica cretica TaxID=69181 RepID=A0ABQ7B278_BRACR|nr:hypothetical protein DY000_02059317 [Brassica cretica]
MPTKQVVGNNSSEFLLSSEIPRNFPTEFRGNKLPRKFRGPLVCRKCPRNIPRENFVGIFPRTFIDRCVLDIYTSIDRNIPTDIFLGIFRGNSSSVYSEETKFCVSSEFPSLGYSEDFIFRRNVRQNIAVFL